MIKLCNFFMLFMEEGAIKITTWENSVLNMTERAFMLFKCNLLHGIPLLHTQLGYFQEREISFSKLISFCTAANLIFFLRSLHGSILIARVHSLLDICQRDGLGICNSVSHTPRH